MFKVVWHLFGCLVITSIGKTVLLNMSLTEILWQSQIANPCVPCCLAVYGKEPGRPAQGEKCRGWG